jgi:glutathione peroxidase
MNDNTNSRSITLTVLIFMLAVAALFAQNKNNADMNEKTDRSFYDFSAVSIDGDMIDMSEYRDKVVLIVNTASKCGYTPQYAGLQALHEKYANQGLVVLGFPCNQFANQEPGSEEDIASFCESNYGVTFQMFSKVDVNGENAHPLYKYLKDEKSGTFGGKIKWNFTKFLIDRQGNVVSRHGSGTKPESMEQEILALLVQ